MTTIQCHWLWEKGTKMNFRQTWGDQKLRAFPAGSQSSQRVNANSGEFLNLRSTLTLLDTLYTFVPVSMVFAQSKRTAVNNPRFFPMILCIAQTSDDQLASLWDFGHGGHSSRWFQNPYSFPWSSCIIWILWGQSYKEQLAICRLNQVFVPDDSFRATFHMMNWVGSWTGYWGIKQDC